MALYPAPRHLTARRHLAYSQAWPAGYTAACTARAAGPRTRRTRTTTAANFRREGHTVTLPGSPPVDFLIIGAGVIGCALARELARYDLRVGVLEQVHDVGDGTSKANSGILHTGFDAKPGTLESRLVREGRALWQEAAPELGVPIDPVGAIMLAITDEQAGLVDGLLATARHACATISARSASKLPNDGFSMIRPISCSP